MNSRNQSHSSATSTRRSSMDRLVDVAVDDLVEQKSEALAQQLLRSPLPSTTAEGPTAQGHTPESADDADAALSVLQEILLGTERTQMERLAGDVESLRRQLGDKDALAKAVAPILGDAIKRQIQDSREEIIDALYPVIGQIVMRAVTEAIRDLARSIDEKLREATDFQRFGLRFRALITGVPAHQLALRQSLPFAVQEIYLLHRDSGLLLWHATPTRKDESDSDLIGAMLTAIREFAEQALGGGGENLHQMRFGQRELVMEFARYSYVAVLVDGVVPSEFRWQLHKSLYAFEKENTAQLRNYDGEASTLHNAARQELEPFLSVESNDRGH